MAAFGLDDVRESYTSDVTRFLAAVETSANVIVAAATHAIAAERSRQAPVDAMVVGLHGIVGSSSLIGLDSMTGTARRLETIAASASESIRMVTWHAARLQRIATICLDSAGELRAIRDHELAGQPGEARNRSAALHARLDVGSQALEAAAPPPSRPNGASADHGHDTFAPLPELPAIPALAQDSTVDRMWGSAALASEAVVASDDDDELAQAFRDETRETLTNLIGYWARLDQQPDDGDAAGHCARLLHLLRGSAAMVRRDAVAARAGDLHGWLETVRRQGFTRGAVDTLGRGLEDIGELALGERPSLPRAATAALPPLPPSPSPSPSSDDDDDDDDDEPRQIFFEEASRAIDELHALNIELHGTAGPARDAAIQRTERLWHRLKGSALIVGEPKLAELAARAQELCEPPDHVSADAIAAVIQQVAALVAQAAQPAASASVHPALPVAGEVSLFKFTPPSAEEWEAYLEESSELLDDLDRTLTRLDQSARPTVELSAMFRIYHTLKGASSAVGLAPIAQQLHAIESFVERIIAAPELPPLRTVASALADEHAAIRANIVRATAQGTLEVDVGIHARLAAIGERAQLSGASWIAPNDPVWATPVWEPAGDDGQLPRSHASRAAEPAIGDEAPATDDAAGAARRFVRVAADRLDGLLDLVGELVVARLRMLTRIGRMQHLHNEDQDRHGAVIRLVDDFASSTEFINLDGRRGKLGRVRRAAVAASGPGFGALELDHYEEIHVLSRQLEEAASDIHEMRREIGTEMQRLTEDAEALSTVVGDLQIEITQARMLTIETLFTRLQLPIRDAAQRLGREVEIVTRGESVAIDKSISDALFGPLLHMVRNAVVHGIEDPVRRRECDKPRAGTLTLSARQDHGQLVLEISDDGQGIDAARLKAAGVDRGLIDPATPETDPRVLELVFVHGISTSEQAGELAGRGVGGNVIRRAVERLSGTIDITTERGTGTTFRITLPLSMSITQAVVVRAAGVTLAIPIAFAETILACDGVQAVDSFGRTRVQIAGKLMPVHRTTELFGHAGAPGAGVFIVCVVGSERIAIQADEVVGQEEIVVKSLGTLLDGHPLFAGSTQRGDGELVLILDIPGVLAAETTATATAAPAPIPASSSAPVRDERSSAAVDAPSAAGPVTPAAPTVPAATASPSPIVIAEVTPIPFGRRRVLFVDDSLSVRKVAERMLRSLGVDVVTAIDGQDALDKLRTMAFSLVFTDLEMPKLHGYDLIREMQYLPVYRATPIIVISSRSGQKHIDQALAMGAREYLTKPFSLEVLHGVLARWAKPESPAS